SWPADDNRFSRNLDRAGACGSPGPALAVRNSNAQRYKRVLSTCRLTGPIECAAGGCCELALDCGFLCTLPPVSQRAFCHHGLERGRLVSGQYYLVWKFAVVPRGSVVGGFSCSHDRGRTARTIQTSATVSDDSDDFPYKRCNYFNGPCPVHVGP